MKVLVIGGGGREHAIVDALANSSKVDKIYAAPGNAGIADKAECVAIKDTDVDALLAFVKANAVELTVVGPEASLALGIVDVFEKEGLKIFGPKAAAAQVESSKQWAKDVMKKYDIPTARYEVFSDYEECLAYVREQGAPIVLKYDGLAAGKGVVVAETLAEAEAAVTMMLKDDKFGEGKVVVEECMRGPEFSLLSFVNGAEAYPMPMAQDHKRAYEGDKGPNTGGMGVYTPLSFLTEEDHVYAMDKIVTPMVKAMKAEGAEFRGVLYAGLMKTESGIKVIEFNARFGDPETEVILPLLESDIYDIFVAMADGNPVDDMLWADRASIGIVMASKGYPDAYAKGLVINGLDTLESKVFHMGTALNDKGELVTNGGRVLFVTTQAETLAEAREQALADIEKIDCDGLFWRRDIGWQAT